jgi:hypothetical protein
MTEPDSNQDAGVYYTEPPGDETVSAYFNQPIKADLQMLDNILSWTPDVFNSKIPC